MKLFENLFGTPKLNLIVCYNSFYNCESFVAHLIEKLEGDSVLVRISVNLDTKVDQVIGILEKLGKKIQVGKAKNLKLGRKVYLFFKNLRCSEPNIKNTSRLVEFVLNLANN